jgi:hypothetical protein
MVFGTIAMTGGLTGDEPNVAHVLASACVEIAP